MKKIEDALKEKKNGLYFGNRIILPFHGYILKIVIDNDILEDFSPASKEVCINETEAFTEIYFTGEEDLREIVSKYESIKIIIAEKDKDIFNKENHLKLALRLGEDHLLIIEQAGEDTLFIE